MSATPDAVQRYLEAASAPGRAAYLAVRDLVRAHAPDATETISYAMPTFLVGGKRLMHASAWKEHLSIYPLPDAVDLDVADLDPEVRAEVAAHGSGASTLKLPYTEPFPTRLVDAVVRAHLSRLSAGR